MKIAVDKIDEGRFIIRDDANQEHLKQLSQSLKEDGQWNPIIVRPLPSGRYEVISGHYRLQAAKIADMKEIEATVRDLSDEEADVLSLKTNTLRLEMTPREEGKVLSKMMQRYGWNQTELAKRLNVDEKWVGRRLRVALELHEEVAKALDGNKINFSVASAIGSVPLEAQPKLLKIIIEKNVTGLSDAELVRKQFLNDTVYTVGYQGRTIDEFIKLLKTNGIDLLLDARYSAESQYKPDFSGEILKRELARNNIKYEHRPELGVPFLIQTPYKDGYFSYECLKQWYTWHINTETDFNKLLESIKKSGKTALMCMEKYAKAINGQNYACHRDILANLIIERKVADPLLKFEKRVDL
jgi:ParB/RepB/Spo0J family partition protein